MLVSYHASPLAPISWDGQEMTSQCSLGKVISNCLFITGLITLEGWRESYLRLSAFHVSGSQLSPLALSLKPVCSWEGGGSNLILQMRTWGPKILAKIQILLVELRFESNSVCLNSKLSLSTASAWSRTDWEIMFSCCFNYLWCPPRSGLITVFLTRRCVILDSRSLWSRHLKEILWNPIFFLAF